MNVRDIHNPLPRESGGPGLVAKSAALSIRRCSTYTSSQAVKNGTLYIGSTDDLARRVEQHCARARGGFTSKYDVGILVWFEMHETREAALLRERA
jgi:hypothetical protein